jgi:hypothetical protein
VRHVLPHANVFGAIVADNLKPVKSRFAICAIIVMIVANVGFAQDVVAKFLAIQSAIFVLNVKHAVSV